MRQVDAGGEHKVKFTPSRTGGLMLPNGKILLGNRKERRAYLKMMRARRIK